MILRYKTQWQNSLENPYRFFFPFSIIGLLIGLGMMFIPPRVSIDASIILWHREIMLTLFLMPVMIGFLYTATPRFFNSFFARPSEIFITLLWIFLLFFSYFINQFSYFVILKLLLILQVLIFVMERYIKRKSGNPLFAPFIFISLITAFISIILQIKIVWFKQVEYFSLFRSLYYHATFWVLLFGVGTKFFPMLTLTVPLSETRKYQILNKQLYSSPLFWYIYSILFVLTFVLEAYYWIQAALWLRAILVLFLSHEGWYLYFPSQRKGVYTFFIKLFLYSIVIGHFIFPFFPEYRQHFYHLIFVGGFLGLVLIVFGRVIISHEKLDLNLEVRSKTIAFAFSCIYIAMWARITSHLVGSYENHLKYASLTAITGILFFIGLLIWNLYKKYFNQMKNE